MTDEHFNELTPAQAELLACLAEECGEVVQAIGKILRHGYESMRPDEIDATKTNRSDLERECGDILATIDLLVIADDMRANLIDNHRARKHESRKAYFHHQPHHRIAP